jgi:hypothetical protein
MAGKNINYFLMDGTPGGRIKCTISNWTGVAYRIPRTELEKCKERDDLKQSGVYFLFGIDEETGDNVVYVGQAGVRKNGEGILYRLQEHKRNTDKDYWTEAVVFTTSNNSFGPTEISWLENRFCALAINAKRYIIKNGNDPNIGNVTEEKESELEEFVDYAKIVMGVLGHKIFEPLTEALTVTTKNSITPSANNGMLLYFRRKSKKSNIVVEATCLRTTEGFVVKKGSLIEKIDSDSIPSGIKKKCQTAKIDDDGILQEDVLFTSPSYAAAFVIGGHVNGLTEWKTDDGKTLKDIESSEASSV